MTIVFGTDGVRGCWGDFPLNSEGIKQIAVGLSCFATEENTSIAIGMDTRESSIVISKILNAVFSKFGVHTINFGVIPTPGLAYSMRQKGIGLGVMISASHNPWHDNGIKCFRDGIKLNATQEKRLEALINQSTIDKLTSIPSEEITQNDDDSMYCDFLKKQMQGMPCKSVLIDAANGAASITACKVFEHYQITEVATTPNGRNINEECGATFLETAQNKLLESKSEIGIVLDGDADRLHLIDEQGGIVDGDAILYLLAKYSDTPGVVGTLMSNVALEMAIVSMNKKFLRTDVGDKYVAYALEQEGWFFGAEPSGHVIAQKINPTGDGILAAILIMNIMFQEKKPLLELLAEYIPAPQVLLNIRVKSNANNILENTTLKNKISQVEQELGASGRVLVRASGTQPLIRVMVEGLVLSEVKAHVNDIAACVRVR